MEHFKDEEARNINQKPEENITYKCWLVLLQSVYHHSKSVWLSQLAKRGSSMQKYEYDYLPAFIPGIPPEPTKHIQVGHITNSSCLCEIQESGNMNREQDVFAAAIVVFGW